jgi:hypothetical protein
VRFSTRGVQKHHKKLLGKSMSETFGRKSWGKKTLFPFVFSHRFFLIEFWAVSLHEEPKNTIKIFSKIKPENLKKTQKR